MFRSLCTRRQRVKSEKCQIQTMWLALEVDHAHDRFLGPRAPVLTQYQIRDPKRLSLLQSYPAKGDDVDEDVGVYGWAATTSQQAANAARHRESKDTRRIRRSGRLSFGKQSRRAKGAREKKRKQEKLTMLNPNRRPTEVTWTPARWVGRRLLPGSRRRLPRLRSPLRSAKRGRHRPRFCRHLTNS
jgi:hypothetical protein